MSNFRAQRALDLYTIRDFGSLLWAILCGMTELVATSTLHDHAVHRQACRFEALKILFGGHRPAFSLILPARLGRQEVSDFELLIKVTLQVDQGPGACELNLLWGPR